MKMSIENQLKQEIEKASMPVSVEYLSKKLKVGWGTIIRYCLELVIAGKICGLKTTKSWVFWRKETSWASPLVSDTKRKSESKPVDPHGCVE